ncbi:MAG TPA: SCO family protein [Candidatus Eremiobacteraceae bacterium]|nr:SCO family protein [Candidatus Eremiobacteraceae bacterium]
MRLFAATWASALALSLALSSTAVATADPTLAPNPFDQPAQLVKAGDPMPATRFLDQRDAPFGFSDLRGDAVAVAFVYTRCRDACPIITRKFGAVHSLLGDGPFRLVEVTIDPRHDTPSVLAAYAHEYGIESPQWRVLTGDAGAVDDFDRSMGIHSIASDPDTILHDERIVLVTPDDTVAEIIEGSSWTAADLAAEMKHVANEHSSLMARVDLALGAALAYCGGALNGRAGIGDLIATIAIIGVGIWLFVWVIRRTTS